MANGTRGKRLPMPERFWVKVDVRGADDCWVWQAATLPNGYGYFWLQGSSRYAHRIAYTLDRGSVPPGLYIDHLCRNRRCVNPRHLEPVTCAENIRRGMAPSTVLSRENRCKWGHVLDEANSYMGADGRKRCRICSLARSRRAYKRNGRKRRLPDGTLRFTPPPQ